MTRPLPKNTTMTAAHLSVPTRKFLARHGLDRSALEAFEADASPRRYFRVVGEGLLLMEERQDPQGFAAYLRLSHHLNGLGLSAPRVFGADPAHGLALVEDFGDATYGACLGRGQDEAALYRLAVDTLLHLHHDDTGNTVAQPEYVLQTHLDELAIFSDWFVPAVAPDVDITRFNAQFLELWREALQPVATRLDTLVLRDFHIDNLMLLDDRSGVASCGLLDFQDGVLGPCEYDLVSLLQDARRDLSAGLESELLGYYARNAPAHLGGAEAIRHRYALLGAQRHARILGVFVRLCQRDSKPRYLTFIPRVLRQFQTAMTDAGLTDIADFLDETLPGWAEKAATLHETLLAMNGPSDD